MRFRSSLFWVFCLFVLVSFFRSFFFFFFFPGARENFPPQIFFRMVPPLLTSPSPTQLAGFVFAAMALHAVSFSVYVALVFVLIASNKLTCAKPGVGSPGIQSLLQPYDFLYYSGVRAYFGEEWSKAAELLEKSIVTKDSLTRVRKKCHDECVAAGREAVDKLGEFVRAAQSSGCLHSQALQWQIIHALVEM